jgi:prevent-host-death family protein
MRETCLSGQFEPWLMRWSLTEAKRKLSDVVRHALAYGPQVISIRGEDVAIVVSKGTTTCCAARIVRATSRRGFCHCRRSVNLISNATRLPPATLSFDILLDTDAASEARSAALTGSAATCRFWA